MSDDLISRQAVIEHLSKRLYETALNNVDKSEVYTDIAENRLTVWVDELPSVQPKEKTGKWLHDQGKYKNRWICTECSYRWYFPKEEAKYCPNCGAKMEV